MIYCLGQVTRLAKLGNIVGLKEDSSDLSCVNCIRKLINDKKFLLRGGDDLTALEFIQLGGGKG
ncbi:MAG: dihydrodipicolinate synthase family protein [Arsenophonus sp. NEOnobi-MAG3]